QLFNMKENRKGLRLLFAPKTGFISRFIPKVFDFAKKDFHPDQHDTEALVAEWKVRLFGENGELNAWTRNLDAIHLAGRRGLAPRHPHTRVTSRQHLACTGNKVVLADVHLARHGNTTLLALASTDLVKPAL